MTCRRVAVIGSHAHYLVNFRGALIQAMRAHGHEVLALAPDFDAGTRSELSAIGVEPVDISLSRTGLNPVRDFRDIIGLYAQMRRLAPDVVLAYTVKPVIYGLLAAALARVPRRFALITGLGYVFSEGGSPRDWIIQATVQQLYRIALRGTEAVFMQNRDDADEFVARRIVSCRKIIPVNGSGVDLAAWPVMDLPGPPVTFALAARLLGEKGVREYVTAARQVKAKHPEVRFLLLGGLDSNPSAIKEREVASWVAEGVLEWPGHVNMRPWLAQTSVFVLPSYREGIPRSTQEAMAAGRPVITTDAPGCRETVVVGENGYLVPPRDVGSLVGAMLHFVENPQQIVVMGRNSRRLAEERFDVRAINERMLSAMGLDETASPEQADGSRDGV
ncbi:glycosyltransferase family 4 protein [Pelagibius marinus]|uniref:glycosyltransferase family 4 protein n=1 Tax=Pelagibius marinus TaxID=2762760 RepID=UPI00187245D9|nr:glycosyltransferase family 4 protein [Pelagibius marinus]